MGLRTVRGAPPDVLLGYGADDPPGEPHGRWWQQALPMARLEVVSDVGLAHVS